MAKSARLSQKGPRKQAVTDQWSSLEFVKKRNRALNTEADSVRHVPAWEKWHQLGEERIVFRGTWYG